MNTNYQLIKLSILLGILVIGCKTNKTSKETDEFTLFTTKEVFDSTSRSIIIVPSIDRFISISANQSLDNKVNSLLDSISKNSFNNLKIESLGITEISNAYKSLKLNLLENDGFKIPDRVPAVLMPDTVQALIRIRLTPCSLAAANRSIWIP